ncbi:MAG: aminopeptidase P family N-terminal domain-containing protein, partial [Nitrosopumilaceae archaeon]
MNQRRRNLLKFCNKTGCDTIVAFEPENLFYMTGFWGEAISVLDNSGTTIIAPELEVGRAKEESADCKVVKSERGKGALSTLISKLKGAKVCTDGT